MTVDIETNYDFFNMNDEEREAYIAHQHVSHFSDNKHHNKVIDEIWLVQIHV